MGLFSSKEGLMIFPLFLFLAAVYCLPIIVAFKRSHPYRWVILVMTLFGGWTGLFWLAALIWAVFPENKTIVDPLIGSFTGIGNRNSGDTMGGARFGLERGYREAKAQYERSTNIVEPNAAVKAPPVGDKMQAVEVLERLHKLLEAGAITTEEYFAEKKNLLG